MKQVNESFDLPRLAETDPGLAEELTLLKSQLPDASELALVASRLQLQGIDVASPAATTSASPTSAWPKWLLGGGGAVALGLGLWALGQVKPAAPFDSATARSPQELAGSRVPAAARTQRRPRTPSSGAADAPPGGVGGAAPLVNESPAPHAVTPPSEAPEVTTARPVALPAPAPEPSRVAVPRAAQPSPMDSRRGGSSSSGVGLQSATTASEIELLREARLALRRSPTAAFELTEQHARAYPSGKLVQERELIAVSALIATGRRTAALSRAARFEQAFPQSPYRKQLAELLR